MPTRTTKTLFTYFTHKNRDKKKAAKEKASQWDTHDRFFFFLMRFVHPSLSRVKIARGGSFYFLSEWEPGHFFKKTLLKMAGQKKQREPCRGGTKTLLSDTLRKSSFSIFSTAPQKVCAIPSARRWSNRNRGPDQVQKMEWGRPLPKFDMVQR